MIGIVDFFLLPRIFFHRNTFERNLLFSNTRTDRRVIITCQRYRHGNLKYIYIRVERGTLSYASFRCYLFIIKKINFSLPTTIDLKREREREKSKSFVLRFPVFYIPFIYPVSRRRGNNEHISSGAQ